MGEGDIYDGPAWPIRKVGKRKHGIFKSFSFNSVAYQVPIWEIGKTGQVIKPPGVWIVTHYRCGYQDIFISYFHS